MSGWTTTVLVILMSLSVSRVRVKATKHKAQGTRTRAVDGDGVGMGMGMGMGMGSSGGGEPGWRWREGREEGQGKECSSDCIAFLSHPLSLSLTLSLHGYVIDWLCAPDGVGRGRGVCLCWGEEVVLAGWTGWVSPYSSQALLSSHPPSLSISPHPTPIQHVMVRAE